MATIFGVGWRKERASSGCKHAHIRKLPARVLNIYRSGKPGAGKSTLMRYVLDDNRSESALKAWANGDSLVLSFFIWKPAKRALQKNIVGFERALIYQILEARPELTHLVISKADVHNLGHSLVWTHQRASPIFLALLGELMRTTRCCIFVDGLDEIENDPHTMLRLLQAITQNQHVKICASSRPEAEFHSAFAGCPKIRLHELTRNDIESMTTSTLEEFNRDLGPDALLGAEVNLLKAAFLERSNEVFLWVRLALASIRQGMLYHQTFDQLLQRLEELPQELENLYAHIVQRIPKEHLIEVVRYIRLMQTHEEVYDDRKKLSALTIALTDLTPDKDVCHNDMTIAKLVQLCQNAEKRVQLRTAGLLECSAYELARRRDLDLTNNPITVLDSWETFSALRFIHRTAREYLLQAETALRPIIESHDSWNAAHELAKSIVRRMRCWRVIGIPLAATYTPKMGLFCLRLAEMQMFKAHTHLFNDLVTCSTPIINHDMNNHGRGQKYPWFLILGEDVYFLAETGAIQTALEFSHHAVVMSDDKLW